MRVLMRPTTTQENVMKILIVGFFQLLALFQIVFAVAISAEAGYFHYFSIVAVVAALVAFYTSIEVSKS